jgi:CHAT domain-containing protein/tetratricopeptide (TPR) repeat protein
VRKLHEQKAVRRYLLEQLSAPERETVKLELFNDDSLAEELEIVEDELIDEYLANELSATERTQFEKTFLADPERERKLRASLAFKRHFYQNPPPQPPPQMTFFQKLKARMSPTWVAAGVPVAVVALIVFGVFIWRGFSPQSDLEKGLIALNAAYSQQRPVEARISKLDYAPFITPRGNEPEGVNTLEQNRAERYLLDAVKERPNADSYHALGQFYLTKKEPDRAIEYLEQARRTNPNNAQVYADLGVAYLEKGKTALNADGPDAVRGKGIEDLGRSLEFLKQALEIDPNLIEALFNRALVHQYQGLYQQAEADWRSYLEKDSSSQWAVEAQQNLKRLEERKLRSKASGNALDDFMRAYQDRDDERAWKIYQSRHQLYGNEISRGLVTRFLANHSTASPDLQALNYLAQLETSRTHDSYTSDLANVYNSASPPTRTLLAEARQQVEAGVKLSRQSKFREATELFTSARNTFERIGDVPEALVAEAAIAHGAVVQPDLPRAFEILARLIPTVEAKQYRQLLARCVKEQAHLEWNLNNYSKSISDANRALQLFQELKDSNGEFASLIQLGGMHLFLNDNELSLSYLERALAVADNVIVPPAEVWSIQTTISFNLSARKLYRAALDYQNEALQLVLPSKAPLYLSHSYQNIGLTYGSLQKFDLAVQSVRQAYDQGRPLAAERNGQNMMAYASLKLGDLYRAAEDPINALAAYDESSRRYEALGFAHYNYAAHKGKFLSYLALNNDSMAEQELTTVQRLFDEYREKIMSERQKAFFFDREQDTYDLAIDFAYSRLGDARRAFDYSEISKARHLHELMVRGAEITHTAGRTDLKSSGGNTTQSVLPLSINEIQRQLPERVQLVQYAVLEKKVLVWLVTRSKFSTKVVDVEASKLGEMLVTTLKQIGERADGDATNSLKSLYRLMVEPVREELDPEKILCFVPDEFLHSLPFQALVSPGSGRYLLQDFQVMTSPSATILIQSSKQAGARASVKDEHLLAIGNPKFDRDANPSLSNLPHAEREVERIASTYTRRRVLMRSEATRNSVLTELDRSDVAHFAAHYEIDPRSSLSSRLLLGSEQGERAHAQPPGLSAGDVYQKKLPRTRLVVLAGCKTGVEQQFAGEGPMGFARSFLVAGVPVVVASLWPVDSQATAELMIAFHRFRKLEKLPTTAALMRAQEELMKRGDYRSPYYWAGFAVVGGYADF